MELEGSTWLVERSERRVEQNTNSSERAQVAFNQSQTEVGMFDE